MVVGSNIGLETRDVPDILFYRIPDIPRSRISNSTRYRILEIPDNRLYWILDNAR